MWHLLWCTVYSAALHRSLYSAGLRVATVWACQVRGLLRPRAEERLEARSALEHTWFTGDDTNDAETLSYCRCRRRCRCRCAAPRDVRVELGCTHSVATHCIRLCA